MNIDARGFKDAETIFREFGVSPDAGLEAKEVEARLKKYGPNSFSKYVNPWRRILLRQLASPFIYLLMAAALFSWVLHANFDALFILSFIVLNTGLGFFQEYRSEKTLRALRDLIVPMSRVRRGGKEEMVPTTALVPGDVVLLRAGDVLPADLRFTTARNMEVDESAMSGEAFPVAKNAKTLAKNAKAPKNIGFAATVVVQGEGEGVVYATGKNTNVGSISGFIVRTNKPSAFQKHIAKLSTYILYLVIITLACVLLLNLLIKGPQANAIELIIFSIALAVSVVPEALPLVMTFSFSRGAKKLAKQKVVVKRLSSVEDLGNVEILCTDKTGTLTENAMRVAGVLGDKQRVLACAASGSERMGTGQGGPFDTAIWDGMSVSEQKRAGGIVQERFFPFDPMLKMNGAIVKEGNAHKCIIRGAPEQALEVCGGVSAQEQDDAERFLVEEGRKGRRVIGIAMRTLGSVPKSVTLKELAAGMEWQGLVSFEDPVKKTADDAIQRARRLGIQIKVITGDRPEVAGAIAEQVKLCERSNVIAGDDFDALTEAEQLAVAMKTTVFARMNPMQKAHLIGLLQRTHTVAFLGDGINDAPALKASNVSMAVKEASDIAREAADIVLLKKDLHVIIDGIREGRIIFANTTTYLKSTLASNFGNFYSVAILSLFVDFLPLLAVQILLINLLTDLPLTAISTDEVERAELRQPKRYDIRNIVFVATLLGAVSSLFDFIVFILFIHQPVPVLQSALFMESVLTELLLLFSIRSKHFFLHARPPSNVLVGASAMVFLITIIVPFTYLGRTYFQFATLLFWQGALVLGLVGTYFLASEFVKLGYYRLFENRPVSQ